MIGRGATGAAGRGAAAILLCGLATGCGLLSTDPSLPVYTMEQTDSAHAGHRKSTITNAGVVYVNDYEEQALQMSRSDPKEAIGRGPVGGASVFAIEGQDRSAYVAVDEGSEMPAYGVYRNASHPPFDWRNATFRTMRLDRPDGPTANKETTDRAILDDVVRTLRDGALADPPPPPPVVSATATPQGVYALLLSSDQLPGIIFRPSVYVTAPDKVYLSDNLLLTFTRTEQSAKGAWIPVSPAFANWVQTP
ncbi:MAG TPA: hypothetical protein VGQ67_03015 [Candidatus Polarisedimenticolia bacterium]|jgi:hypothetical protein|nr:hypothetical protein [Candidatus Polarisedimenticolia bacterium]